MPRVLIGLKIMAFLRLFTLQFKGMLFDLTENKCKEGENLHLHGNTDCRQLA